MIRRPRLPDQDKGCFGKCPISCHSEYGSRCDGLLVLSVCAVKRDRRLILKSAGHLIGAFLGSPSAAGMQILGFFQPLLDYVKQTIEQLRIWSEQIDGQH